jgi:hypothetical protein
MPRPGPFGKAEGRFCFSSPRLSPLWFSPSLVMARSGATKQSMGASRAAEPWIAALGSALLAMTRSILRRSGDAPETKSRPSLREAQNKKPRRGQRPNGRRPLPGVLKQKTPQGPEAERPPPASGRPQNKKRPRKGPLSA